jgi:hypothetical protein
MGKWNLPEEWWRISSLKSRYFPIKQFPNNSTMGKF